ncbi:MAG: nucleotidyltransferase domain-containing protein [Nitrospirota bacterium]
MIRKEAKEPAIAEKKVIENAIKKVLEEDPEISFAYIHGSFVKGGDFNDIDLAIYLKNPPLSPLDYELKMETELMDAVGSHPIDVRVLNVSPLSFRYNVIKGGVLLIVRDDDKRTDFHEATLSNYLDFVLYRNLYLKETLGLRV